jgi:cytoskeletal protein RodZ
MGITTSTFLSKLQHHALQVWFFAISFSLLLTMLSLLDYQSSVHQEATTSSSKDSLPSTPVSEAATLRSPSNHSLAEAENTNSKKQNENSNTKHANNKTEEEEKDTNNVDEKEDPTSLYLQKQANQQIQRARLYKTLLLDSCDIFIPGSAVGWIDASTVTVGIASCISSLISLDEMWKRVQNSQSQK